MDSSSRREDWFRDYVKHLKEEKRSKSKDEDKSKDKRDDVSIFGSCQSSNNVTMLRIEVSTGLMSGQLKENNA